MAAKKLYCTRCHARHWPSTRHRPIRGRLRDWGRAIKHRLSR